MGGLKVGSRKIVVVTGASSGLGLWCTKSLVDKGNYFVICGVRDVEKMRRAARELGIKKEAYLPLRLELGSMESIKNFAKNIKLFCPQRPIDHLVCNAAIYRPTDPVPAWTDDGYEMSFGVNHLGQFLLVQLLLPDLKRKNEELKRNNSSAKKARVCWVGSITGNNNTIGGGLVYPRAEVGELQGLKQGPGAKMGNGGKFDGAKAYKDSKALNMMTITELHRRFHEETGIEFSSMYPGCIAETNLFREKRRWFKRVFPLFMKYVTGGYVSEVEAGERLAQVIYGPQCSKSGVYWSWNGNAQMVGLKSRVLNKKTGKWEWQQVRRLLELERQCPDGGPQVPRAQQEDRQVGVAASGRGRLWRGGLRERVLLHDQRPSPREPPVRLLHGAREGLPPEEVSGVVLAPVRKSASFAASWA